MAENFVAIFMAFASRAKAHARIFRPSKQHALKRSCVMIGHQTGDFNACAQDQLRGRARIVTGSLLGFAVKKERPDPSGRFALRPSLIPTPRKNAMIKYGDENDSY